MSDYRYPNIGAVFGVVDGLIGCVFGLIKLIAWLFLIGFVVAMFSSGSP